MSDARPDREQPSSEYLEVTGLGMRLDAVCNPASFYKIETIPVDVTVTNVRCSATGTGTSICALVNPATFAAKAKDAIEAEQTRQVEMICAACETFKLADFDKTRTYSGSDAVFLDPAGKVVPSGPSAVSRVDFDWSFNLRFFGEFGLCVVDADKMTSADPLTTLS